MQKTLPEEAQALPAPAPERNVYAGWKCPDCGSTRAGYISPTDFKPRRCLGIPKSQRTDGGRICGALMVEVYRGMEAKP
jgi:hypothetical protein